MAKIEANASLLNSNFNFQKRLFSKPEKTKGFLWKDADKKFSFILDKLLEGRTATLHTFSDFSLQVSGSFSFIFYSLSFTRFLDKSLEDRSATLHTLGKSILQISRASF